MKKDSFFSDIDWKKLGKRELQPPQVLTKKTSVELAQGIDSTNNSNQNSASRKDEDLVNT